MKKTLLLLLLGGALAGCSKPADSGAAHECELSEDCGEGLQCIDHACIEVQCTTSGDCPFDSYCDIGAYTCVDGCLEDTDCLSGFNCDSVARTCVEAECRDTQLDCEYGELCDEASGACIEDSRDHCSPCDVFGGTNQCPGGECFYLGGTSCNTAADCDPGYECDNLGTGGKVCHADHCYMNCNPSAAEPCPRGFDCVAAGDGSNICFADCPYMMQNGYL